MTKLIHSKGTFNEWLLPEKLYHGTSDIYLDSILKEGLKINHEDKNSMLSLPLIYLTTSLEMASDFAKSVSHRKKGNPIVIEINSKILEADSIGFDWNISLKLCSQCITYQKSIEVNSIVKNIESIKNAKMIFDEPENLNIPVVWNMLEESTWLHLEKIGYQDNRNKVKKIKL